MNNRTLEQVVENELVPYGARRSTILVLVGLLLLLFAADTALAQTTASKQDSGLVSAVRSDLSYYAQVLGDRLCEPGKERIAMDGVLTSNGKGTVSITFLRESTGKVRIAQQGKASPVVFNSAESSRTSGVTDESDEDLLETLVYDWPDHFFLTHGNGSGLRLVTRHFQLTEGGRKTGLYYNVYETLDEIQVGQKAHFRSARYYLNTRTGLLDRVWYRTASGPVEVRFSDWHTVDGQRVPGKVERLENHKNAVTLVFTTPVFGAKASDGAFSLTGN